VCHTIHRKVTSNLPVYDLHYSCSKTLWYQSATAVISSRMCSPEEVYWRFRGTYCLRLQGRGLSRARKQQEALTLSCLLGYTFSPEYGRIMLLQRVCEFLSDYTASRIRKRSFWGIHMDFQRILRMSIAWWIRSMAGRDFLLEKTFRKLNLCHPFFIRLLIN
jgi:hypothetical protein